MKTPRKQSVYFYFLLCNLVIIIVPVVISITAHLNANHVVRSMLTDHANMMLSQSSSVIEERVRQVKDMALNISTNSSVLDFSYEIESYGVDGIYGNYLINKVFRDWTSTNSYTDQIFAYFSSPDIVVALNDNAWNLEDFLFRRIGMEQKDSLLWGKKLRAGATFSFVPYAHGEEITLFYIQNIPFTYSGPDCDKLVLCLDRDFFGDVFSADDLSPDSFSMIVNSQNDVLYQDGDVLLADFFSYRAGHPAGNEVYRAENGQKYMISYVTSQENGWQYVSIIPLSYHLRKVQNLNRITVLITCAGILAGLLLSLVFARKHYAPVKKISSLVEHDLSGNPAERGGGNEWGTIEKAIHHYQFSAAQSQKNLRDKQAVLREIALFRLLSAQKMDEIGGNEIPGESGLQYQNERFLCALLETPQDCGADTKIFVLQLNNVANDIGKFVGRIDAIHYLGGSYALVLNLLNEIPDMASQLDAFFHTLIEILEEQLGISCLISIGNIYHRIPGIGKSFGEACKTQEYRRFGNSSRILRYFDIHNLETKYFYPISIELELMNDVRQGKFDRIAATLDMLIDKNFNEMKLSDEMATCLLFEIFSTSVKTLNDLQIDPKDVFPSGYHPQELLLHQKNPEAIKEVLREIYGRIGRFILSSRRDGASQKCEKIKAYLQTHYQDPNLCLAMVADEFQMNQTYLSFFFREETGENLINYVRKLKVGKAREYLRQTSLPLSEIAEKVGYSNSSVLIRNFKKEEGMTPSQFRDLGNPGC